MQKILLKQVQNFGKMIKLLPHATPKVYQYVMTINEKL